MVLVSDALARLTVPVEVEALFCGAQAVTVSKVVTAARVNENRIRQWLVGDYGKAWDSIRFSMIRMVHIHKVGDFPRRRFAAIDGINIDD